MKRTFIRKIRKATLTVLGIAFFIGAFIMCGRMETEDLMDKTYTTVGKVMHNEYINRNTWEVTVNVDGEEYKYFSDRPENLLSEKIVVINNKGTLKKSDDELIDAY